jgi:hypothetical protein
MAKDHGPSAKNDKQYEGLRKRGMSKQRAASIANSPSSSSKGGKKSSKGRGGSKSQKRAAGRTRGRPQVAIEVLDTANQSGSAGSRLVSPAGSSGMLGHFQARRSRCSLRSESGKRPPKLDGDRPGWRSSHHMLRPAMSVRGRRTDASQSPASGGLPVRRSAGSAGPVTPNSCRTWGSNGTSGRCVARSSCPASRIRSNPLASPAARRLRRALLADAEDLPVGSQSHSAAR